MGARGDGSSGSRLNRPLEVPHPRVAAAALLQQHGTVRRYLKPEQLLPAGRQSYMQHAVHVGLGNLSQLLDQPGLDSTPLHFVATGEQVQQDPAVLHMRHISLLQYSSGFISKVPK